MKVLLDVLNAQQDYYRSLRQFKTSRYDYMVLLEKFRQVVGVETLAEVPVLPVKPQLQVRSSEDLQFQTYSSMETER